jgi:glycolate oxidase iron-sulfur subunit
MAELETTAAWDEHHPPERALIDDCVHCGFCLPTCPTYMVLGEEMDSPRGRIYLMKEGLEGEPLTDAMATHFDRCLGCMACVTACPSGVRYDRLIEATRQQLERRHARPAADRGYRELLFSVLPYPGRLRLAAAALGPYERLGLQGAARRSGVLGRLPARLQALEALAPPRRARERVPQRLEARGVRRARVGLLAGCAQRVFFSHVNAATARVLAADGCDVVVPPGQPCCGALSLHAGREAEAQVLARRTIDAFEDADLDHVVVNAAGCGSALKEYGHLLRDDPAYAGRARAFSARVRDVLELLDELGPAAGRRPLALSVAYHDACHIRHAQGLREEPRRVLRAIPGLELRELADGDTCCGSAGVYNLLEPEMAAELGGRKARHVLATRADILVTANPGCLLQVRASLARLGRRIPLAHPVELVDASIHGVPAREVVRAAEV